MESSFDRRWTFWVLAGCGAALLIMSGLVDWAFTDYDREAQPAFARLVDGDLSGFLQRAPSYGGSMVLRAPFAWVTGALGGGDLAVYRSVSIPAILLLAGLAVHVAERSRALGQPASVRWLAVIAILFTPIVQRAVLAGHPEDLMATVGCVAAVLAAARDRSLVAGALLGLAIASKLWAVLAIGPVLLALPSGRLRMLVCAGAVPAIVMAPFMLQHSASTVEVYTVTAGQTGSVFNPHQLFWFLAEPGADGRIPPEWLTKFTHPAIALSVVPVTLVAWRCRGLVQREHALGVLAFLMLGRCMLDAWNIAYYAVPLVVSLATWEVVARGRAPWLSLATSVMVWWSFRWLPDHVGDDAQCLLYLAWTIPLAAGLALATVLPSGWERRLGERVQLRIGSSPHEVQPMPRG